MNKIAIISAYRRAFNSFVREIDYEERERFVYISRESDCRGRKFSEIISLCDAYELKDYDRIKAICKFNLRR